MAKPDTPPDPKPRRLVRLGKWAQSNPADAIAIVLGVLLAVLAVLTPLVTLPIVWEITAAAALASAVAVTVIVLHHAQTGIENDIRQLKGDVGKITPTVHLRELDPRLIDDELLSQLDAATSWHFRGASARWQRGRVLPRLSTITDRVVNYRAQVLNPFDDELCQQYADYRRSRRHGPRANEEAKGSIVQRDLLAFLFALAWFQHHGRIKPKITLLQTYSPMRIDASDKGVIVTVPDKAEPGLRASSESWYYSSILDEYEQTDELLHELVLPTKFALARKDASTAQSYFTKLIELNKIAPGGVANYTEENWKEVVDVAFEGSPL